MHRPGEYRHAPSGARGCLTKSLSAVSQAAHINSRIASPARAVTRASARVARRSVRVQTTHRDQWYAKIAQPGDQSMQRRLVGHTPGDRGHASGFGRELEAVEAGRPAFVENAVHADLIPH